LFQTPIYVVAFSHNLSTGETAALVPMVEISNEEYKLAKEAHVSNCTGGRTLEIALVCHSIIVNSFIKSVHLLTPFFIIVIVSFLILYGID
jgi:hypothetical protein